MVSTKKKFKTINEYINIFPKDVQNILEDIRKTIKEAAPESEEVISYQLPAFKLNGILVYFGAFKNHIGFFPTANAIKVFSKDLSLYETSKGTIRFPLNKPIPYKLVKKITKFRVKENLNKINKKMRLGENQHF